MSRLSAPALVAWRIAALEAVAAGHEGIAPGHLAIGVLSIEKVGTVPSAAERMSAGEQEAVLAEAHALRSLFEEPGGSMAAARRRLREALGSGGAPVSRERISRTQPTREAFAAAAVMAGSAEVRAAHLLLAVIDDALVASAVGAGVRRALVALLGPDCRDRMAPAGEVLEGDRAPTPELDRFGRDLTKLAREGALAPVVGRREVLLEVIRTLAREGKANPLLVGEAGVGKTAIVEALAMRGAEGKDAAVLGGLSIVELNLGLLLGGTEYRGAFEKRVNQLVEELRSNAQVLVFIDEIHTLVGAGRAGAGGLDAANMLKPALARGELRCIGATTLDEYRRHLEPDAAFARRFVAIRVHEPTRDEAVAILHGTRQRWESHHGVRIADEALAAAVDLSVRFVPDRRLPDKAVDLVDLAAARTRVPRLSARPDSAGAPGSGGTVTALTVAQVLAESRDLPLELVRSGGAGGERLLEVEGFLRDRLVGQDEAISRVARRLKTAHAGLSPREGPLAVFLFTGPTGIGKTEMARLLAEFLFGSRSALVRLDMSEFMEEHSVARLVGSPPGYVGHEEEGQLTGRLRAAPYSLVLLDEVEKAHPKVLDIFLQLFGDGRLTDGQGRLADGRQAVFVMTSNLGAAPGREPVGFPADERSALAGADGLEDVRRFFRPELLNRVDEVIRFRPLGQDAAARILRPLLDALAKEVENQHGVTLSISSEAEKWLALTGVSADQGARGLKRTVERLVAAPLSDLVLSGRIRGSSRWRLVRSPTGVEILPG